MQLHLLKRTVVECSALLGASGKASQSSKLRMYMQTSPASFLIGAMTWLHMNLVPTQKSQEERRTNKKENKVIGFLVIHRLLIKHKVSKYPFKVYIHIIVCIQYTTQ